MNKKINFKKQIEIAISKIGSMRKLAIFLKIPYRTLQDWKLGNRAPNAFVKAAVIQKIIRLNDTAN